MTLVYAGRHTLAYAFLVESVATVPGAVIWLYRHIRSTVRALPDEVASSMVDEAENERMHLLVLHHYHKPTVFERVLLVLGQLFYYPVFAAVYFCSPAVGHRVEAYMEEQAVKHYTELVHKVQRGVVADRPAPLIARRYWNLPQSATLLDVLLVIRADEMDHRDAQHDLADRLQLGTLR